MKLKRLFAFATAAVLLAGPVHAGSVILAGDSNIFTTDADNEVLFRNVFNGQTVANYSSGNLGTLGTTATATNYGTATTITAGGLSGADYLIFGYGRSSVSGSELSAIVDFVNGGGSLFLFGEGNTGFTALNTAVNSILSAVGSSMRLSTTENADNGGFTTLSSLVASGPLAAGVNSWTTAYTAKILLGSGTSIISGVADTNEFTTFVAGENVSVSSVPLPGGLPLILGALGLFGFFRMRQPRIA